MRFSKPSKNKWEELNILLDSLIDKYNMGDSLKAKEAKFAIDDLHNEINRRAFVKGK